MQISYWAIAVVIFNFGLLLLLMRVLKVVLKLPHWLKITQLFFGRRVAAAHSLSLLPSRFERLNQFLFNSNQQLLRRRQQFSGIFQLSRLGLKSRFWTRHRR